MAQVEASKDTDKDTDAAPGSMRGLWVEYWAVEGHADTQGYALFEDGRFGWRAASGAGGDVVRRWGQWTTEGETLVLRVQGEELRGGCTGEDCKVLHDPARELRLELGECPPNEEAKALDASYRCISIAGQAFWRRAEADAPTAYLPPQQQD